MSDYETVVRGRRVGVNRDGQPVGYAVRIKPGLWTAYVYTEAAPFDFARPGFETDNAAVAFIAEHGRTPEHLRVTP